MRAGEGTPDVLFLYVEGSDLDGVVATIEPALDGLAGEAGWRLAPPRVVNQLHERDGSYRPEDLTDWDLGLDYALPDAEHLPECVADIERMLAFVGGLAERTGRAFVVGVGNTASGVTEDLAWINGPGVDIGALWAVLGIEARR